MRQKLQPRLRSSWRTFSMHVHTHTVKASTWTHFESISVLVWWPCCPLWNWVRRLLDWNLSAVYDAPSWRVQIFEGLRLALIHPGTTRPSIHSTKLLLQKQYPCVHNARHRCHRQSKPPRKICVGMSNLSFISVNKSSSFAWVFLLEPVLLPLLSDGPTWLWPYQ